MSVRPELISLARESRGLTQKALADQIDASQARISKIEAGAVPVDEETLASIAQTLGFPPEFFVRLDRVHSGGACFKYRKRAVTGARNLRQIEAATSIQAMRIASLLKSAELAPAYPYPKLDVGEDGDFETPTDAADRVRALWGLPQGPVHDLTGAIEAAGGIVVPFDFETPLVDAMSLWPQPSPPIYFVNHRLPGDRLRWTLAHETGHLVMHHRPSKDEEGEADEFAGELLMPSRDVLPHLRALSIPKLATLKQHWRVSMAALIVRASRLGAINDQAYRNLNISLSRRKWKRTEPFEIQIEQPKLFLSLLQFHIQELGYSLEDLCRLLTILPQEYNETFGATAPSPAPRSRFRVL